MAQSGWKFWIDVGGTFTDVVACRPDGTLVTDKLLSSGRLKGRAGPGSAARLLVDERRRGEAPGLYDGYTVAFLDAQGGEAAHAKVARFDGASGRFELDADAAPLKPGADYELFSGEPAPVVAIRRLLGKRLGEAMPGIEVRLGTTRGTNALLERKGAATAWVTTRGFGDLLRIGSQERPELFRLDIRKPEALFREVVELDERIAADGTVLEPLGAERVRAALAPLKAKGIASLAVCLLNSYRNDAHERIVAEVAKDLGFDDAHLSISSAVSPTIKMVSRGDTTVVDAYLTPVVRDYVGSIQRALPGASLRLLTSAGGLVGAEFFTGRDSILSGPAGGVVGFSRAAQAAGFPKAIGFDMGGTSTDVSRFEGQYEYQFETRKAGVRVVAPMLAVETVAAGGGSICAFDGQKLVVGPESAGADPGPACYGRGGPLAVTDLNVYLGKIPAETFPFPLDIAAIERRLSEVAGRVEAATGKRMAPAELAEGFTRIANANMAAPIKQISIARGYDVREYALVCFGGAGGQHACAIARSLGMPKVLLHPYAGVLSAFGMGMADVKKFGVRSVLAACSDETLLRVRAEFEAMATELRTQLREEGIAEGNIQPPRRMLEMRYAGQSAAILVDEEPGADFAACFERRHEALFGHAQYGRAVEVVTARLELAGTLDKVPALWQEPVARTVKPSLTKKVLFGGSEYAAGLFVREDLRAGDSFDGPAIVVERIGTVVVDPGWRAERTGRGDLVLTDLEGRKGHAQGAGGAEADPVQLEIFNNHFASIAEQMGVTLQKTSLSTNVKERLDFSCAIFTATGELVANAPHVPVHLGAMGACVQCLLEDVPDLKPGDVLVTNDPFRGGSHLPDVTVVTPVHDAKGQLLFFTGSRAHHAEMGGKRPGSLVPDATSLADEGVLIRHFKVLDGGASREAGLREILAGAPHPSRAPDENLADIRAQIAANRTGARELQTMLERYGSGVVLAYMNHIRNAAERKMRAALARLPDGERRFEDRMDDGTPIVVTLTKRGETAVLDFAGTGPVNRGNLNANPAIVRSAVLYCLRCLIDEDIPLNGGVLAPVTIRIPEGILNPPAHPDPARCPAVIGGNVETSQRVVDVVLGALGLCAASQGTMNNFAFGDASFGYYETICGGAGAGPGFCGADAVHTHMTNTRLTDPEVLEARYPVRLIRFAIRKGSGGAGKYRGGDGIVREVEFLKSAEAAILSNRRTTAPYGLAGGQPGASGRNLLKRAGEEKAEALPWLAEVQVAPGDTIIIETPGGGGYGC